MKLTVRYTEKRGNSSEVRENTFVGERASLGRGTNQSIQIQDSRVPLEHSSFSLKDGTLELKSEGRIGFSINDRSTRQSTLADGDTIDILGHEIKILKGEGDVDYIVDVLVVASEVQPLRSRFITRIWALNFPQRKVSWFLFVTVLMIGLIIPSVGFLTGMDFIRQLPLPDDGIWEAGTLHHTHAFLGDDCGSCHTSLFVPAQNEDCLACHQSTSEHYDTEEMFVDYDGVEDCQDCHREHNGPEAMVRRDQAACAGCHEDLEAAGVYSERIRDASDFFFHHPYFSVTFYQKNESPAEDEPAFYLARERLEDDPLEQSNLKFPHDLHVAPEGINGVDGNVVLECTDCHETERSQESFSVVNMQSHCASCHELTFDPETPDRVVPHGAPAELMQQLRGYYAYRFLHKDDSVTPVNVEMPAQREARRPGKRKESRSITEFQAKDTGEAITAQATAFIDEKVAEAAANLFERQTCTICHEVSKDPETAEWTVVDVKMTQDWFPMARFSHLNHKTMPCQGCHLAEYSDSSEEVLMPDIDVCTVCHGGEHAEGMLQSTCIDCHKFHLDGQNTMSGAPIGATSDIMLDHLDRMFGDQAASQTAIVED